MSSLLAPGLLVLPREHPRVMGEEAAYIRAKTVRAVDWMPKKPKDVLSPRYKARIGYESEYTLVKKLVSKGWPGWYAVRTPGSGSGKMAKPDIIAVENGELYAIEVKSSRKPYVMLNREQVRRLLEFCRMFRLRCPHCGREIAAKPVVAVRFMGHGWEFVQVPEEAERPIIVKRKAKGISS